MKPSSSPDFVTVARVGEIDEGQAKAFEVGEYVVAVFLHEGQYYAIDDMCPHMGASLATGHFDVQQMNVACPWHGWRFDVRDGTWCDNRRIKTDVFAVRVVDGDIQLSRNRIQPADNPTGEPGKEEGT
ncbi:MAG: Rieske 2Fe-2S domain-containing protein [Planctomycetota bacterium]|nr:Rieske 2Fe-2S domain-containing protein [Planctomycetota bacterium]